MLAATTATEPKALAGAFEIRFQSLINAGRALVFPCDADGRIDLARLSDRARDNYFFARALVGRDYGTPRVVRTLPAA